MTALAVAMGAALAAGLVAERVTNALADPRSRIAVLDHPTERSLHAAPTPRGGGLGVVAGVGTGVGTLLAAGGGWIANPAFGWVAAGLVAIAVVSWWDDVAGLPPAVRLAVHVAAAVCVVASGLAPAQLVLPGGASLPLAPVARIGATLVLVVWLVNLVNFMDGMDGLAGGMAIFGFGTYALLGLAAGASGYAAVALVVVAAAAGFLRHNFPPARIFLGDVGACTLGYLAAVLALAADRSGLFPTWIALLVLSPFVVDATVTLARRIARGERVWQAHRTHYYQRVVGCGWSHRRTLLVEYGLMLAASLGALASRGARAGVQLAVCAAAALVYAVLARAVGRLERAGGERG